MAIQAERHDQVGVMRLTYYVMILKETMQAFSRNSFCFEPLACYTRERFQARVAAEKAERASPKAIFPP